MKKLLIGAGGAVVVIVAWYLLSPLWRVEVRDEASPLAPTPPPSPITDALDTMTSEMRAKFDAAVEAAGDEANVMAEAMPNQSSRLLAESEFKPRAHEVQGKALLIETASGRVLRFENFETINGPNLHIYLASSLGDEDYVDLGVIRATKGNVNYEVPASVDTNRYNKVLVWCVPFQVLFSYAELR